MKQTLLSLLAITTLLSTSSLSLTTDCLQVNKVTTSNHKRMITLEQIRQERFVYKQIRNSDNYINMRTNYRDLEWHAQNWGLSFVPIYGNFFSEKFREFFNKVVEPLLALRTKLPNYISYMMKINGWLDKLESERIPWGLLVPSMSSESMMVDFQNYIAPAYRFLVSEINSYLKK